MDLRFTALVSCAIRMFAKGTLVCVLLSFNALLSAQTANEDVKKQADKFFEEENYSQAYKLYSQLVSNFPKNPVYNYKLGVCMIYAEPDKKKCTSYLKFAAANAEGNKELKDVLFYLGKAYHINYRFDEAIKNYNDYKLTASASQIKKLQVDHEIKACSNGKRLLSNLTDLEVISKTELSENDYFRSYKKIGGKLLVKPDEFKTSTDKKKKEKSVVFLPTGSDVVYFSSYGDNSDNGRDIYTAYKIAGGTFSKPEKVPGINTEYDEDYPFLHPDGKTLYFASKGYNSMGGYDIFKSVFDENTKTWSPPVNLEFPINSPDDDYLFVTDSLETTAYFSTGRQSPPGKIDVLKVKTKRRPVDIIALKGQVIPGSPDYPLKSTINVKDIFTHNEIGSYSSEEDGSYTMELPNGGKLLFTVETPGLETQSVQVSLPLASAAKPFRQTISYDKGKLKILNYFDEVAGDDSYLQYLNVIEKKAKLDVSQPVPETTEAPPLATNSNNPAAASPADKEAKEAGTNTESAGAGNNSVTAVPDPRKNMSNKQLAQLAREDASESRQEAAQLHRDYIAANETGLKQKEEADRRVAEANDALFKAETIADEGEKKIAIDKANALKIDAEKDQVIAGRILDFAKNLDDDAKKKEKEASLNVQYAAELEKSVKSKDNKASLAKLEELQKQIGELSGKKNSSDNAVNEIKANAEQKEKQITELEEINDKVKANLEEIKTAISDKESELEKTKKKAAKKEITTQIEGLKADQDEKTKQIAANEVELQTLNQELDVIKNELALENKIKTETIIETPAAPPVAVVKTLDTKSLQEKYKDKVVIADPDSRSSIEESTAQLNSYNRELDQLISKNKAESLKTKNANTKLKLSNEIKQAEATKKQNQTLIAGNNKKLTELNTPVNADVVKNTFDPINAESPADAVNKLDQLNTRLNVNDNENFDYNGYQNPTAQSLKVEADAKINEAIAKQKKLKDDIATSKEEIRASSSAVSVQQLNKEAEDLFSQSQKLKDDSKTKKGAEKEKLLSESKKLEEQALGKNIEASEIVRSDNAAIVSANQENIQNLINEGKSGEADVNQAKTLNEEAKAAYRKASDIRVEGNSLSNAGGKLGSYSNAEEKEAEAIAKQKQAIEILAKNNPDFKLKVPVTSTSSSVAENGGEAGNVNSKLQTVNAELSDLAAVKVESYQKLYEANDTEISQLNSDIKDKQSTVDKTPSLKTDLISANNKLESAKTFKQNADNASSPNEKLNNLIAAVKKQTEAIKQLGTVNKNAESAVASVPAETSSNQQENSSKVDNILADNPLFTADQNPPLANDQVTVASGPPPNDELSILSGIDIQKTNSSELALKDTTTDQLIAYFDNAAPSLKNPDANSVMKASLSNLKDYEAQAANLDEAIKKAEASPEDPKTGSMTPKQLNAKSDALLDEADGLNDEALGARKEAESKDGEEKERILSQAKELESEAQDKMLEASEYRQQANENEYKTNMNSIDELLAKLKNDNPALEAELESKRQEYMPLRTQISNLRTEANALSNKAAKLGAISNAEEKEQELIQRQNNLLAELKKQYPDFIATPVKNKSPEEKIEELKQKRSELREKQYTELTNLTNAFSLEFESSKNSVPANLSPEQESVKQNAEELNADSKRLLIQSVQEKNENEKIKLLTLAVKSGNAAIDKLSKITPKSAAKSPSDLDELSRIGNEILSSNDSERASNEPAVKIKPAAPRSGRGTVKVEGLEVQRGNAYSAANPIPIDAKMEDGLVFRVQIGAFKTRLADNAFKGLSPLNGETTNSGYIRYTAGNFNKIENANAVKNDLRNLGYSDAFVVVYFNGKRITMAEALAELERQGKKVDPTAPQTAGITANANVPKAAVNPAIQESVTVTKELEQIDGLLYTIQIGVYTKQVSKSQILSLRPIFREQLQNGLYRYTAGIYNNPERLLADKNKVVEMGIRDAFVSAYLNGKRIPFNEAKERQSANDGSIKLETENPVIFPDRTAPASSAPPAQDPLEQIMNTATIEPFKNSVSEYPAATAENGVKTNEEGVSYKVQIGAFSKQIPEDVAAKFSAIKSWPIDNKKINGLYIYNIGNFSEVRFAKNLREEAIRLGITDAFITVYRDGKKLYGPEAETLLR